MDKDLLYQKFLDNGGDASYEEFQMLQSQFMVESPNDELKKKDQPTENGSQNLTTSTPTPQTELPTLPNPIPENEFTVPLGSEQDLMSASSDTTVEMPSTDLPLTDVVSSGTESLPTNQPLSGITNPTLSNMGNTPMVRNIAQNGKRATLTFEGTNENPIDILGGKNNDIQGEITMTPSSPEALVADALKREQEAQTEISNQEKQSSDFINQYVNKDYVNANPIVNKQPFNSWGVIDNTEAEDNLLLLESKGLIQIQRDADGAPVYEDNKYRYKITDKEYYDKTYTPYIENLQREAEKQAREQNVDSARFNLGNAGNNPEQDSFGEFMSKASKLGAIPTTEEYEYLVTEESQNEYLANLEAIQNAQKNKTTVQEEYDKIIGKYNLTDEVKFANGFDAVNLLNQGIENGKDKDKAEIDYFGKFFSDRNNVLDFGEYWEREGKAKYKSSLVRENQANYQSTRADIWNDYLNYKNDKLGVNQRFLEEAVVISSAKADNYALAGNTVALEQEKAKMESLYNQYEANQNKMVELSNTFYDSNKNFTEVERKKKEQEDFEIKVQNGEVGANVKNILGQIPLALSTSINATLTGIGRIASSVIPSENLKDALDIMSETELKVGNVKVASLTDKIKTFKGSDGLNYKEINGKTYGVKSDGTIFKTTYKQNGSETNIKEEVDYNGSGMVFLTAKMVSDIYLTTGVGKGLNSVIGSYANRIANSTKVAQVFGEGSHLAKTTASFAKLAKNADNVSVTGWYVQMYNDSYKMAEQGGITDPVNKHLYAVAMSFTQSIIQRINPDTNFLKPLNTNVRQIARALINENPANAKQAVVKFFKETADASIQYAKKAGNNVPKEVLEEIIQQGTQDVSNLALNGLTGTNFQTSSAQDYEELVVGTIVPSAVASLLGGKGSNVATINNKEIDITTYSRNDLITELARDAKGIEIIKDFKESAFFQSQKDSAQKIEDEISTRKKYIDKIPDAEKYPTSALSEVTPILQELDRKREQLKKDDGTFAKTLNAEIETLTTQVNSILSGETESENQQQNNTTENAETPQPTPQPETVQEQTNTTDNEPEQTAVQQPKPIAPIEPSGGAGATAESGVEQTVAEQPTQNISPNDETNPTETTTQSDTATVENVQDIPADVNNETEINEDNIVLPDDFLDLLNNIDNETVQTDNPGTDGNTESGTDSLQQSEQTGETNQQEVHATADNGGSEGNAEVADSNLSKFKKGDKVYNKYRDQVYEIIDDSKSIWKLLDSDGNISELNANNNGGFSLNNNVQQTPTFSDNEQAQTLNEEIIPTSNPNLSVKKTLNPTTGISYFEFINTKSGKPVNVSDTTQKKYLTEIVKNTTYPDTEIPAGVQNEGDLNQVILQDSKNPFELANVLITMPKYKDVRGTKEWHIANNITRVSRNSFINFSDKNNITIGLAKAYFAKKGTETNEMKIDRIAFKASSDFAGGEYGNDEITTDDVVKFMLEYRQGTDSFFKQPNPDYQTAINRFVGVTGMNPTQKVLKDVLGLNTENIEVEQRAKVYAENQVDKLSAEQQNNLANEYDQWFNSLTLQEQTLELQNTYPYENISENQQAEVENQPKSTDSKRQSSTDAPNESTAKQGEKASRKTNTSPEYQQLLKDREAQEAHVKSTKETLDHVSKNTNKDFQADQVNLFEERQAQEGMFDERADGNAGKEIIAKAKRDYDQAKADLAKTNKAIRDFESGNASGTGAIDFLFYGERGATQYANNEIDNLVKAKIYEEQGKTPKEILDATGWFKGAEGKWRKETDNKFAFSFPNFQLEDGEVKRMKLKDVLNYPQLFKLYPRLENVNLVFRNENTNNYADTNGFNTITVYTDGRGISDSTGNKFAHTTGAIIHEIQHIIQSDERFASGYYEGITRELLSPRVWRSGMENPMSMSLTEYARMVEKRFGKEWRNEYEAGRITAKEIGDYLYENTAGEVEAFNAQRRSQLTEEQLRNELPKLLNVNPDELVKSLSPVSNFYLKKQFTTIPQSTYDKLVKRLLGVFKKFGGKVITTKAEVDAKLKEFGYEGTDLQNITPIKSRQLEIINRTNPAPNNYNTWVRSESDILTAEEAFRTAFEDGEMYPDFTIEDMQQALDSGFLTVYSSKPIEDGNFVTPSKMNAQEYAGGKNGKVYSQKVKTSDIAWIDESEGQYARIEFMKTKDGEIYGAKFPDGTIYLNPEKVNANTPIHEFSHLWQQLMPTRFKKGVELLKNTPIGKKTFADLKANEGYANKSDEELWNEAMVTIMGNEGERIFNAPRASKLKEWLTDLFKALGNAFGIRDLSPNDKLSTFVKGALSEVMGTKEIIPESNVEQKEVPIYIKKMSNTDLRTMLDKLGLVMDAVCP